MSRHRVSVQLRLHQKVSTFRFEHDLEPIQYYILINEGTTDRQFKYCIFISYCEIIFLMQIFLVFSGTNIGYIGRADSWAMQNYSRQDLWEHSLFPSHWRGWWTGVHQGTGARALLVPFQCLVALKWSDNLPFISCSGPISTNLNHFCPTAFLGNIF